MNALSDMQAVFLERKVHARIEKISNLLRYVALFTFGWLSVQNSLSFLGVAANGVGIFKLVADVHFEV